MTRSGRRGLYAWMLAICLAAGCAQPLPKSGHPKEVGFPDTGVIGVISSIRPPSVDTGGLPRTPEDAAAGAAAVVAELGHLSCLPPFPALFPCLIAATIGTGYGAAAWVHAASESDNVNSTETVLRDRGQDSTWQARLRARVVQVAKNGQVHFVDLGDGDADTATGTMPASHAQHGVDHILELALTRIGVGPTGNDRYGITMDGVSRIVRAADGTIVSLRSHLHISPSLTLEEWLADDASRLREVLDRGIDELARDILAP